MALSSVLTAIVTALLASAIFVLVLITLYKHHLKFARGGGRIKGGSSAEGEGQEYEEMDRDVAVSDPTYMEVEMGKGISESFKLKNNTAYATVHS